MRFSDWFEASGLTEEQAGRICGVSRSYIARLKRGAQPSDDIKMQIEVGTEGQVRYEDWRPQVHADLIRKKIEAFRPQSSKASGAIA